MSSLWPPSSVKAGQENAYIQLPISEGTDVLFGAITFRQGGSKRVAHGHANQIVEDNTGFLWIGTEDGLKRYDAYRFRDFRADLQNPKGLRGVSVNALFKDRSGQLWVAADEYLDRFDPASETFTHIPSVPDKFEGPVADINQDRAGTIWLATSHGLSRLELATGKVTRFRHEADDPSNLDSNLIRSTFEEKDGTFWIASAQSLELFDRRTEKVTRRIPLLNPLHGASSLVNEAVHLVEDHEGVLWISSARDGVAMLDRQRLRLTYLALDPDLRASAQPGAWAIHEDRHGTLWLGTNGGGLFKLDRDRTRLVRYRSNPSNPDGLTSNQVLALFEDHEDGIWIGTGGGGVLRIPSRPIPFQRYPSEPGDPRSLGTEYVTSVFEDSHHIVWAGGEGAVNRIDRDASRFTLHKFEARGGTTADLVSIAEDRTGQLWFGTRGAGLYRFDPKTGRSKVYRSDPANSSSLSSDDVFALFVDRRGTLWAGTDDGLNAYDPRTDRYQVYRAPGAIGNRIRAIAEDREGALWLATRYSGVRRFDPATGQFTVYRSSDAPGSLSNDAVAAILVDHSGVIWAGTENGLNRLDPATLTFRTYYERDGLPNSNVNGITEDAFGRLWITTHNGLSNFDPQLNLFRNYYRSDGVLGDFSSAWKSPAGEMFFGSYTGLTTLWPEPSPESPYVPAVVLTNFQISDRPVPIGHNSPLRQSISTADSLTLSYRQSFFSFEFTALSYINPERTRYRYRLEELGDDWNEVDSTQRSARYATLAPGTYVFRVQGRTSRSPWSGKGMGIRIVVLPPWWATWWFRALCVLAAGMMIWAVFLFRVRQLAQQLTSRFEERLRERTRIAQELHDTLLQGFISASMQLDVAAEQLPADSPVKPQLSHILDMMHEGIEGGRNAVNGLRLPDSGAHDLAQAFSRVGQEFAYQSKTGKDVNFRVVIDGPRRPLHPIFRDEAYRIGREALVNAFRHSSAETIEVTLSYAEKRFRTVIRDDGCGIDPTVLGSGRQGHWGLQGMRERTEKIGARLRLWSRAGEGTEVELSVPGHIAYQTAPHSRFATLLRRFYAGRSAASGSGGMGRR